MKQPTSQPPPRPEQDPAELRVILRAPVMHRFKSKRLQNRRKPLAQWMRHGLPIWVLFILVPALLSVPAQMHASADASGPLQPAALARINFEQRLNNSLPLEEHFRDENGSSVKLGQYFGQHPAILVLGYNRCPMLCSSVLNGLVKSIADLKRTAGKDFSVLFVSIDPSETPSLAAAKRQTYLRHYDRPGSEGGWHFLTGEGRAIQRITTETGFSYAYDPVARQYAHPSGLIVVTPQGRISRYFFGGSFPTGELNEALSAASRHRISSPIQQFLVLCFHYNPITGKYGGLILNIVRLFGLATMLGLGALVFSFSRPKAPAVELSAPVTPTRKSAPAEP